MVHQEKKYRVNSFGPIEKLLSELGAKKGNQTVTIHYYAQRPGNDVVKLVEYRDRCEIHMLKELNGKFSLTDRISAENTKAGLQWLRDKGYKKLTIVTMTNSDYRYKDGVVGLYIINDSLYSVILDFPQNQHEAIARELGLENAELISLPYNKYLEQNP
ncbi:MAG TPA: hypothetical protein VLG25_00820 [Patescibacteria group bacterium]|nr:hypothetical protein [Patescibacteria group bacterium]